jgi:hypothetical protein
MAASVVPIPGQCGECGRAVNPPTAPPGPDGWVSGHYYRHYRTWGDEELYLLLLVRCPVCELRRATVAAPTAN